MLEPRFTPFAKHLNIIAFESNKKHSLPGRPNSNISPSTCAFPDARSALLETQFLPSNQVSTPTRLQISRAFQFPIRISLPELRTKMSALPENKGSQHFAPLGFVSPFYRVSPASPFGNRLSSISQRRRIPTCPKRVTPSCVWVQRSATVLVEMDTNEAYSYYIDLEAMPEWSPWLRSVEVDKIEPDVSRWTLAARGIEVSWKARNTKVIPGELIAWKSESGLSNRGRVVFAKDGQNKSNVTLAVEFDVPRPIARAIDNDFIGRFVEETLLADMKRFRSIALQKRRKGLRSKEVSTTVEKGREQTSL